MKKVLLQIRTVNPPKNSSEPAYINRAKYNIIRVTWLARGWLDLWGGIVAWPFYENVDTDYWILITGYWLLGTDYWILITGYWLLGTDDTDYWVLITGYRWYWLLGTDDTDYWVPMHLLWVLRSVFFLRPCPSCAVLTWTEVGKLLVRKLLTKNLQTDKSSSFIVFCPHNGFCGHIMPL